MNFCYLSTQLSRKIPSYLQSLIDSHYYTHINGESATSNSLIGFLLVFHSRSSFICRQTGAINSMDIHLATIF
jgi:hypothetical protein